MEISFSQLKQKDVINLSDGKHLGRVWDLTFNCKTNTVLGLTVTGCKGFKFTRQDVFIPMENIEKIGEDVILVKTVKEKPNTDSCPPEKNGKPCNTCNPCNPTNTNSHCPPNYPKNFPPRRNLDEYE